MLPVNSQVSSDIIHDDFYTALADAEGRSFHTRLAREKTQAQITATYTSLGSAPEPHQMSGAAGGGPRQAAVVKDWIVTATVNEWESTVYRRRLFCESDPQGTSDIAKSMAFKAMMSMGKTLCIALNSTTDLGYDSKPLFSTTHGESGSSQSNKLAGGVETALNIATPTAPTAAEVELCLNTVIPRMKGFVDDQGTPILEGVTRWVALIPETFESSFNVVVNPTYSAQVYDASGVTGRFRGMIDLVVSAYASDSGLPGGNKDVWWLFAAPDQTPGHALAFCKMVDWRFNNNVGDDGSDDWQKGYGYLRSYAVHVYKPWNWPLAAECTFT